ncbi:MAG: hypothetical protein IGS48_24790 [Oscillatoriales cyanobacterium C42_A2020_001]|nr:hypothetical protein [Leptolyngbyaceae cyanobacterium C42_A2020_001]
MLETAFIILIGLIPGVLSSYVVTTRIRKYSRSRHRAALDAPSRPVLHSYLQAQDYHYVDGLGYMVGDLSCQFNGRSAYLRCAVNPSGPCKGCPYYEPITFPEERNLNCL